MPTKKTFLPNIKTLVKCEILFHSLSNDLKKTLLALSHKQFHQVKVQKL